MASSVLVVFVTSGQRPQDSPRYSPELSHLLPHWLETSGCQCLGITWCLEVPIDALLVSFYGLNHAFIVCNRIMYQWVKSKLAQCRKLVFCLIKKRTIVVLCGVDKNPVVKDLWALSYCVQRHSPACADVNIFWRTSVETCPMYPLIDRLFFHPLIRNKQQ